MTWQEFQLGTTVSKVTKKIALWKTDKGILEILENTLALPINVKDQLVGYVLCGEGRLLLDTIVETGEGAIGESVDRELNKSFLMLGTQEALQENLNSANKEDFAKYGFSDQQEFKADAEDLLAQFSERAHRKKFHCDETFSKGLGFIFAFPNGEDNLDILIAKGPKLIFKTSDIVFVSNDDKVVLKGPQGVIASNNGKSVVIRNHSLHIHR